MKLIITENQFRVLKESIEAYPNFILQELNKMRKWLLDNLGLKSIINNILDSVKKNIDFESDEYREYVRGADILLDNKKISEYEYDNFVNLFLPKKAKLVYDSEGKWHPVNKLNTNSNDLIELLTDLLFESYETNDFVKEILEYISKNYKDVEGIKNLFSANTENLQNLFIGRYQPTPTDLYGYVTNNIKSSEEGEKVENEFKNKLESMGYKTLYQGGNGDFIDMIFSVDLIMESPTNSVMTIQVKSGMGGANFFLDEYYNKGKHRTVDILVYKEDNEFILTFLKDNLKKEKKI
jgi:hypothetical protein